MGYRSVTALLPNSEKTDPLPIPEVLLGALDISPNQSQSKWVGYLLQLSPKRDDSLEHQRIPLTFGVFNVDDKSLAALQIATTLSELRNVGIYKVTAQRIFVKYKYHAND